MNDLLMIGCGNMGEAILNKLSSKDLSIICLELNEKRVKQLSKKYPTVEFITSLTEKICVKNILLAIKPQVFTSFAMSNSSFIETEGVLSIMAGVKVSAVSKYFEGISICRVMPNTPALLGESASAYYLNHLADENLDFENFVIEILSTIGKYIKVNSENLLDTVTGLSGSGPAYFFSIIDAFVEAGIKNGLTAKNSELLIAQTMKGAAEMILNGDKTISELKYSVMSPGGTTAAGISALEANGMRKSIYSAVDAAVQKSKDLGK